MKKSMDHRTKPIAPKQQALDDKALKVIVGGAGNGSGVIKN